MHKKLLKKWALLSSLSHKNYKRKVIMKLLKKFKEWFLDDPLWATVSLGAIPFAIVAWVFTLGVCILATIDVFSFILK